MTATELETQARAMDAWAVSWVLVGSAAALILLVSGLRDLARYNQSTSAMVAGLDVWFIVGRFVWALGSAVGGAWMRAVCRSHAAALRGIAASLPA